MLRKQNQELESGVENAPKVTLVQFVVKLSIHDKKFYP